MTRQELLARFPKATEGFLKLNAESEGAKPAKRRSLAEIVTAQAMQTAHLEKKPANEQEWAFVPVRVISEANTREHWRTKAARVAKQRKAVNLHLKDRLAGKGRPSIIAFTRISLRFLDGDNLQIAFKHIRDEIAKMLGFDDRDKGVLWTYSEFKKGPLKPVDGFDVVIEWGDPARCPHCKQYLPSTP